MNVKLFTTARGKDLLFVDGYSYYNKGKLKSDEIKWICRKKNCLAKLYTLPNKTTISKFDGLHCHENDDEISLKKKFLNETAKRIADEAVSEKVSNIVLTAVIESPTCVLTSKDVKNLKKVVYRQKQKQNQSLREETADNSLGQESNNTEEDSIEKTNVTSFPSLSTIIQSSIECPAITMDTTSFSNQPTAILPSVESAVESTVTRDVKPMFLHNSSETITSHHLVIDDDSSPSSQTVYDLCIVGAGMFGSAAARHASANVDIKICLVGPEEPSPQEMPNREIFGSYYDEGRIVSNLDKNLPSQILSKNSIRRFRELEKLSGIDFYYPVGFLWISKINSPLSKQIMQVADAADLPIVDLSFNDIFERRFPYIKLKSDDHPLLDDFGAGFLNPRNLVAAQKIVSKMQGCDIINDVVHEVKPLINGIHEIMTETRGIIKAKRVLICTGAFTNFKNFPMPKLQLNILKETAALLKITFKEARRISSMPTVVYCRPEDKIGAYILPPILYPDGYHCLKIGHIDIEKNGNSATSLQEVKNWYLSKGDPEKINKLSSLLINMLPDLKYEEIAEMTCVTCYNTSGLPYIDRVSPTVTVATVGNGKGAQYSDEIGRIASALSLTGKWESELSKSLFQVMYKR